MSDTAKRNLKLNVDVELSGATMNALNRLEKALGGITGRSRKSGGGGSGGSEVNAEVQRGAKATEKALTDEVKALDKSQKYIEKWIWTRSGLQKRLRETVEREDRKAYVSAGLRKIKAIEARGKAEAKTAERVMADEVRALHRRSRDRHVNAQMVLKEDKRVADEQAAIAKRRQDRLGRVSSGRGAQYRIAQRENAAIDLRETTIASRRDARLRAVSQGRSDQYRIAQRENAAIDLRETTIASRRDARLRAVSQGRAVQHRNALRENADLDRQQAATARANKSREVLQARASRASSEIGQAGKADWAARQSTSLRRMGWSGGANFFAQFSSNLTGANSKAARFAQTLGGVYTAGKKMYQGLSWGLHQLRSGFLYLTVLAYGINMIIQPLDNLMMKFAQLGQRGVRAIANVGKATLQAAGEMEYMRFRMDAVFGAKGKSHWEWLMNFTIGMPHDIEQLGEAFNMLGVYGVDSMVDIKRAMQDVTDTSAALNKVPKDVAMAIGLGAIGAPGGMRRLRQMGVVPADIFAAGGARKVSKSGKPVDQMDPNFAGKNADAILKVLERKFGGVGKKMSNTWQQIMNDMKDMWYRFSYALAQSPAFNTLKNVFGAVRTRFVEMTKDGSLQRYATIFSNAFMSVRPVVTYIAERLPGAVELAAKWFARAGVAIERALGKKALGDVFTGMIATVKSLIPTFRSIIDFYIDLKLVSLEVRALLGVIAAEVNMLFVKANAWRKGASADPESPEYKGAQAMLNAAKDAMDAFGATGKGSLRGKAHGANSEAFRILNEALTDLSDLLGGSGDASLKKGIGDLGSTAQDTSQKVQQVDEDLEDAGNALDSANKKVEQFLQSASTLQTMRYMFLTKSGYSPQQAVGMIGNEGKRRRAYDRSYGTGVVTGDPYPPGATPEGFEADDDGVMGPAVDGMNTAAGKQQVAADTMNEAANRWAAAVGVMAAKGQQGYQGLVQDPWNYTGGVGPAPAGGWTAPTGASLGVGGMGSAGGPGIPAPSGPDTYGPGRIGGRNWGGIAKNMGPWSLGLAPGIASKAWSVGKRWATGGKPPSGFPGMVNNFKEFARPYVGTARWLWGKVAGRGVPRGGGMPGVPGQSVGVPQGVTPTTPPMVSPGGGAVRGVEYWMQRGAGRELAERLAARSAAGRLMGGGAADVRPPNAMLADFERRRNLGEMDPWSEKINQFGERMRLGIGLPPSQGVGLQGMGGSGSASSGITINFNGPVTNSEQVAQQVESGVRRGLHGQSQRQAASARR